MLLQRQGCTLSLEDVARIGRAVRFFEQFSREGINLTPDTPGPRGTRGDEQTTWPVEIIGSKLASPPEPASLEKLFPGLLYLPDPTADPPWMTEPCWIQELPNFPLATGMVGMGRLTSWRDKTELPDVEYDARPVYTIVGSPEQVVTTAAPVNGDPAFQQYIFTDPGATDPLTDPHWFIQVAEDGTGTGVPMYQQTFYPAGNTGLPAFTIQTQAGQVVNQAYGQVTTSSPVNGYNAVQQYQFSDPTAMNPATNAVWFTQWYRDASGFPAFFQAWYPQGTGSAFGVAPVNLPMFTQEGTTSTTGGLPAMVQQSYNIGDLTGTPVQGSVVYTAPFSTILGTGTNIQFAGSLAGAGSGGLAWVGPFTKTYTDLAAASTTNNIQIYSLPAKGVIHAAYIKHSQQFTGGTLTTYHVSVGPAGNLTKYAPSFAVYLGVSDTNFQLSSVVGSENFGSATSIRLQASSAGANLNAATQGSVDVWLLVSTLP